MVRSLDPISDSRPNNQRKILDRQNKWNATYKINQDPTAVPEMDYYTQATVLSKDQLDWLIVGGSYLFFAIIW